jgi:hypothetical protein
MKRIKEAMLRVNKRALASGLIGGFLGALISFLVAAVMLEISSNRFFAIYFGIMFLIIGLAVAKRVTLSAAWTQGGRLSRTALGLFAFEVLLASVACFVLDHNNLKLSAGQRVPFYIFLGMAVSFAVTFAIMDVLNILISTVHTSNQVFLILASSVFTGALFGLVFGILDVEDDPSSRHALIRDERFCAPVGFIVGVVTALASNKMEQPSEYSLVEAPYNARSIDDGL